MERNFGSLYILNYQPYDPILNVYFEYHLRDTFHKKDRLFLYKNKEDLIPMHSIFIKNSDKISMTKNNISGHYKIIIKNEIE